MGIRKKRRGLFFIFLVIGLYLINMGFNFVKIPEQIVFLNKWILLAAGVAIVFVGFSFLKEKYL